MLNDDEQFYDWLDSAPIEYITESEEYYYDEDDLSDPGLDGWDDQDYDEDY